VGNVVLKPGRDGTCRAVTCRSGDILLLSGNIGKGVVMGVVGVTGQNVLQSVINYNNEEFIEQVNLNYAEELTSSDFEVTHGFFDAGFWNYNMLNDPILQINYRHEIPFRAALHEDFASR
jgi:hypothetical protein